MKRFFMGLCICIPLCSICQSYKDWYESDKFFEIGISAGAMNSKTDIGRDLNLQATKLNGSIYVGWNYNNQIAVRLEGTMGQVGSKDEYKPLEKSLKKYRNLNFRSKIFEIALLAEVYPFNLNWYYGEPLSVNPYLVVGLGRFNFKPETFYKGGWIELAPLRIEGQGFKEYPDRKPYKLSQFSIPVGVGGQYDVGDGFSLKLEMLYRFLRTDYLDDVSLPHTDVTYYANNLSKEDAALAKNLYTRIWEVKPDLYKPQGTGPRGGKGKDSYFSFNIRLAFYINRAL